ncbi:MAG: hypothetical protein RLZZ200_1002 [Pseudomonadota bacterium]
MAAEAGFVGLSLDAVARAAGVTKGGLIHHFPSKQALLDAICEGLIERLDELIDGLLAEEPATWGCFTRAYLRLALEDPADRARTPDPWDGLCNASIHIPELQRTWSTWLRARLERHRDTDSDTDLLVARLAADGAWLHTVLLPDAAPPDYVALRARLLALASRS